MLGRFHELFGRLDQGVVLLDPERRILAVNPRYLSLTGTSPDSLLGQACPQVHHCYDYRMGEEAVEWLRGGPDPGPDPLLLGPSHCARHCPFSGTCGQDHARPVWLHVAGKDELIPVLLSYSRLDGEGVLMFLQPVGRFHQAMSDSRSELIRLGQELRLASDMEQALVPHRLDPLPGFEMAAVNLPFRPVGGDLVETLAGPGGWVAYVADLSGKSLPAALLLSRVRMACREELTGDRHQAVERLNRRLLGLLPEGTFLALSAVFGGPEGLWIGNAGNPPPWLRRQNGESVLLGDCLGTVLGVSSQSVYRLSSLPMDPGDLLVLFTDGLSESLEGHGATEAGFVEALAQEEVLQSGLLALVTGLPRLDDVTALALRAQPDLQAFFHPKR